MLNLNQKQSQGHQKTETDEIGKSVGQLSKQRQLSVELMEDGVNEKFVSRNNAGIISNKSTGHKRVEPLLDFSKGYKSYSDFVALMRSILAEPGNQMRALRTDFQE